MAVATPTRKKDDLAMSVLDVGFINSNYDGIFLPVKSFWAAIRALLMASCVCVLQARQMLLVFKEAADIWHQDQWKPLCSACLNLGMNIMFVIFFPEEYKLDGVILSTVLAITFVDVPWETYIMFTRFFNAAQARAYLKLQARFVLIAILLSVVTWCGVKAVPLEDLPGLLIKGLVATIISSGMAMAIFRSDVRVAIESFLNRNKKAQEQ